jgi:hypothetical protein
MSTKAPSIKAEASRILRMSKATDKSVRTLRIESARVTYRAVTEGAIGKGDGAVWATQTEYANAIGCDKSNVTALKRLGKALALGFSPDSDDWAALSDRVNRIGAAIDADDATAATITSALHAHLKSADRERAERKAQKTAAEKKAKAKEVAPRPATMAETLAHLRTLLKGADEATLTKVGKKVADMVRAERAAQAKAAKVAEVA